MATVDKSRMGTGSGMNYRGVKNGSYHIVDRCPPDGGPVRVISLLMLKSLAKVKIPANETYNVLRLLVFVSNHGGKLP